MIDSRAYCPIVVFVLVVGQEGLTCSSDVRCQMMLKARKGIMAGEHQEVLAAHIEATRRVHACTLSVSLHGFQVGRDNVTRNCSVVLPSAYTTYLPLRRL